MHSFYWALEYKLVLPFETLFDNAFQKVLEKEFMFMLQHTFSNNPSEEKSFLIHTQYLIYCGNYTAV